MEPFRKIFQVVKFCVLHSRISLAKTSNVDILRGVPESSRLCPTLVGIFMADLTREQKMQILNATVRVT